MSEPEDDVILKEIKERFLNSGHFLDTVKYSAVEFRADVGYLLGKLYSMEVK